MLIINDKIYFGIVNSCFSQMCNRVMALDSCHNLVLLNILRMNLQIEIKFCIFIIIDKINIGDINHCFLVCFFKFATGLRPSINVRFCFLPNVLGTNLQNDIKFCIHIIIDNIYVGIVNLC